MRAGGDGGNCNEEQRSSDKLMHTIGGHPLSAQSPGFKRSSSFGEASPTAAKHARLSSSGVTDAGVMRTSGSINGSGAAAAVGTGGRHMSASSMQPPLECSFCPQTGFANSLALQLHVSSAHPREQLLKVRDIL